MMHFTQVIAAGGMRSFFSGAQGEDRGDKYGRCSQHLNSGPKLVHGDRETLSARVGEDSSVIIYEYTSVRQEWSTLSPPRRRGVTMPFET
jgi:hypothetical protein